MKKTTPFLPGISAKLYGSQKRRQLEAACIERNKLRKLSTTDLGNLFCDILPVERLETASSLGPGTRRRRVFPQVIVFWAWTSQLLEFNASCNKALTLMDTPENQLEYNQPSGQTPGCGFPVMGFVGVLDLGRGSIDSYVECKHTDHDATGAWRLRNEFSPGGIVVADRAFCSYELMTKLLEGDVQSVMRLHQKRKVDWRRGKKSIRTRDW